MARSSVRTAAASRSQDATGTAFVRRPAGLLWSYLLDEEDPGDFRALLTERRGAPVADALWGHGLARLRD
ncbi:hypothetical protein DLE01_05860, partial [Streptomyces sp. FT05W]